MSNRPTISIYSNGHIRDWLYFRNWSLDGLLLECVEIVEQLWDATEYGDIRARLGKDPDAWYDEEGLLDAVGFSSFDAIIDLTERIVFHRHRYETVAQSRSSKRLLRTPEEYLGVANVAGWPEGALMSFDILGHVWIANSELPLKRSASATRGYVYDMRFMPPIARQAYRDRSDFYRWDGAEEDWELATYPGMNHDAPLHDVAAEPHENRHFGPSPSDAFAGGVPADGGIEDSHGLRRLEPMDPEAVRRAGLLPCDRGKRKAARHLKGDTRVASCDTDPVRAMPLLQEADGPYRIEVAVVTHSRATPDYLPSRTLAFGELWQAVEEYRLLADLGRARALLNIDEHSSRYIDDLRAFLESAWTTRPPRSLAANERWRDMENRLLTVTLFDGDKRLSSRTVDFASFSEACAIVDSLKDLGYIDQRMDFSESSWRIADGYRELPKNGCVRLAGHARAQAADGEGRRTGGTPTDNNRRMRRAGPSGVCSNLSAAPRARTPQSAYHAVRVRDAGGNSADGLIARRHDRTLWLLETTVESASEAPCGIAPSPDEYERNLSLNNVCHFEQEAAMGALRFMSDLIHLREFPGGIPSLFDLAEKAHATADTLSSACLVSRDEAEMWLNGEDRPGGFQIVAIAHELGVTELDVTRAVWLSQDES